MKFSSYFAMDAYSTKAKLMGRQKNGENFMKALVRHAMRNKSHQNQARDSVGVAAREITWAGVEHAPPEALKHLLVHAGFKGTMRWHSLANLASATQLETLYYPAPPTQDLARMRNAINTNAFSLMGVTHTLASSGAMDQLCSLALPPFQDWDALICTSTCAKRLAENFIDDTKRQFAQATGGVRFPKVQLPVIPLGVHADEFRSDEASRERARRKFSLSPQDFCVLFVGRLTFHAKANPAPMYQSLERMALRYPEKHLVCFESGQFPNKGVENAYLSARQTLAPNVRFLSVDGADQEAYQRAWQAADVFMSCSDNIQETFGLTPLEAMAASLPVIVSDWNGYKDTVIDGETGFRVRTLLPSASLNPGTDLSWRHAMQVDTYDYFIGRVSQAAVIDPEGLDHSLSTLIDAPELRRAMGQRGRERVERVFDWSVIIPLYEGLAAELSAMRSGCADKSISIPWINRPDPFDAFAHFSSSHIDQNAIIEWHDDCVERWDSIRDLAVVSYGFDGQLGDGALMDQLLRLEERPSTVGKWLEWQQVARRSAALRIVMLAAKLNLCSLKQPVF